VPQVKVLVPLKRVSDPDCANQVKAVGDRIDTTGTSWKTNPFDECALEAALRLTENGKAPKTRLGEVVVVTLGPKDAESVLRSALACGATRAIRVEAEDDALDGRIVAHVLKTIVEEERPDLVLLGDKAVDSEGNHVGQALAAMLDYPMVTKASRLCADEAGALVRREADGTRRTMRVRFPAIVAVDLDIVGTEGVIGKNTEKDFSYYDGVRFVPFTAILQAKKKDIVTRTLDELAPGIGLGATYHHFDQSPKRKPGILVKDVAELVDRLANEARVL
jgi:electron transfer flavoprotein beta subunit